MLEQWHKMVTNRDASQLSQLIAENAALHSPVVHRPIEGKAMVKLYLTAAFHTFLNKHFQYVREFQANNSVVLEFTTEIDGIFINGIDMITWNNEGLITEFKVMIRPLKAVHLINDKMTELINQFKATQ
ncbi:nuclear transport factor 2 family protein [Colwellia sp. MEBiC06753]